MIKEAFFSPCRQYRYRLDRIWNRNLPIAMCIGLNPSTADQHEDDPTIESIIRILTHNGYGALLMCNVFAIISPNPEDIRSCPDPVKDNDKWLVEAVEYSHAQILCYGNFKQVNYRLPFIKSIIKNPMCLGHNKNGSPVHPLYKKSTTPIIKF